MAPTIQNGNNPPAAEKRPQRPAEKSRSELITRVKYCNTLPDIPFDLKFITYPFQNDRFVQYNPTSLERNYKYEVLTEHDLGVTIDLINRDLYQSDPYIQLDPADEKLLEEDVHTPQDSMRSRYHAKSVSWLRKSEYISTEQTRFQPQNNEKVEAKVGYNVRKERKFVEETLYMDRDAQIDSIEKTFVDNKTPITKHYSKPNVTAVEVLPMYPDFINWKYPCAQVIFDSDPAPANKNLPAQIEEMSQAMIRGVMDESGEQFVAYFLPTEETLEKRRLDLINEVLYTDEQEYEYKMSREYNWNVKSKASKGYEENYFLVMRQDGVYYDELETRVRLSKRRQNMGQQANNTKLVVKHIPLNATEHRMQRYRERQLDPPCEEEEEMEQSEPEEETQQTENGTEIDAENNDENEKEGVEKEMNENNKKDGSESERSARSRSRSARSRSRSKSHSKSRSRSRSRTKSPQSKRSRSHSKSRSRSRSHSPPKSRSVSRERSRSHSNDSNRSGSQRSRKKSRSRTHSRSASKSPNRNATSRSHSRSRSGSHHSDRSHSGSRKSVSRSRKRSRSGTKAPTNRSGSHTPSQSGSASGSD